jgi:hypothetical protein
MVPFDCPPGARSSGGAGIIFVMILDLLLIFKVFLDVFAQSFLRQ